MLARRSFRVAFARACGNHSSAVSAKVFASRRMPPLAMIPPCDAVAGTWTKPRSVGLWSSCQLVHQVDLHRRSLSPASYCAERVSFTTLKARDG